MNNEKYFFFLDKMRESGTENMASGAAMLRDEFGLDKPESREIFSLWRKRFETK